MNTQANEADRLRLQAAADQHLADARHSTIDALTDDDDGEVTNDEIAAMGRECGLSLAQWTARLELFVAWAKSETLAEFPA